MAKNLKIQIKKEQIAKAIKLGGLKDKLAPKKKEDDEELKKKQKVPLPKKLKAKTKEEHPAPPAEGQEPVRRIRARSRSAFAKEEEAGSEESFMTEEELSPMEESELAVEMASSAEEIVAEELAAEGREEEVRGSAAVAPISPVEEAASPEEKEVLGPTGRHVNDLLPKRKETPPAAKSASEGAAPAKEEARKGKENESEEEVQEGKKKGKPVRFKEFRDLKPTRKPDSSRQFDSRDRHGLVRQEDETKWRKKRSGKIAPQIAEEAPVRPTALTIRLPMTIRDLASEMKLKASELIAKLFSQGLVMTLNDLLDDETIVQLLGEEFGCSITIDTTEEERIRITDQTVKDEIKAGDPEKLKLRPPVVAFMGHVDHGKTSLIDSIRETNRTEGEAGMITQHIGAFLSTTSVGQIAILDTPGHEAFSAMRARGADVTDIVVLVVAGDEGLRQQTLEAIQHARAANVTIVVAINKSDKPNFNVDQVYRQLAENELLPEAWGGQTITVNCSAVTKEGIQTLLEMLALQAEVLELRADPSARARGRVLESKMHKGLGAAATLLVQNGTLRHGDALVFDIHWGRVKTMKDEFNHDLLEAGPSTPVEVSGLSGLPKAGQEFIVVKSEKEARAICEVRLDQSKQKALLIARKPSMENLFQDAADSEKKILNIILRADVQGSLEALKTALLKIESEKVDLAVIFAGIGEISEADIQLAAASKALVLGFHSQIERHAESLVKELGVQVRTHEIIYHAIDDVREIMTTLLDKIAQEEDRGKAEVRATFKSSHFGIIAGCQVIEGSIHRNHHVRLMREGECIWKGGISSIRRVKEDVREVTKGVECGIVLNGTNDVKEGDIIESYEVVYYSQEL